MAEMCEKEKIGLKIQLISKSEVRYMGILDSYDLVKDVLVISEVRSHGTEGRACPIAVPGSEQVYKYIVFKRPNMLKIGLDDKSGTTYWINVEKDPYRSELNTKIIELHEEHRRGAQDKEEQGSGKERAFVEAKSKEAKRTRAESSPSAEREKRTRAEVRAPKPAGGGDRKPLSKAADRREPPGGLKTRQGAGEQKGTAFFKRPFKRTDGFLSDRKVLPEGDYDFTKNNEEMEKAETDARRREVCYNSNVSFFDNIS